MTISFVPSPETDRAYRDALGCFATGVTVVTVPGTDGPVGMTVNSFSSISLDPPLVLWSPAKTSHRFPQFNAASHFAIHVLKDDQTQIALDFARDSNAFDRLTWHENTSGVPLFDDCLARFECTRHAAHAGGDHIILVGKVERASLVSGSPLVFATGEFGGVKTGR